MATKRGGLGRGLDALIARAENQDHSPESRPTVGTPPTAPGRTAPLSAIRTGSWQPRRRFDADSLDELAQSIREHGILQPLLVRAAGDGFELIAGERRLRAAQLAGLTQVPVVVLEADDRMASELALIENLQREDLDPIEEAEGYSSLAEKFDLSQEQIAERVGKARATVANALRLLGLPAEIREMLRSGAPNALSVGHAKVLLALPSEAERLAWGRRCARESWSVRELEMRVAGPRKIARRGRTGRTPHPDAQVAALTDLLREKFGTGVGIVPCRHLPGGRISKGHITLEYYSNDDLDRLLVLLGVSNDGI